MKIYYKTKNLTSSELIAQLQIKFIEEKAMIIITLIFSGKPIGEINEADMQRYQNTNGQINTKNIRLWKTKSDFEHLL